MGVLNDLLLNHLSKIDVCLCFENITAKSLREWFNPLINSITEDGAVPYLLDTKERYRASPLASLFIWLNMAGLLPDESVDILHSKLIYLRDNHEISDSDKGNSKKQPGDTNGWSLCEGVSVWSTSMAIIALIGCNHEINEDKAKYVKESVLWLLKQQNATKKGWGYQSYRNCLINPIMTALSVYALSYAYEKRNEIKFNDDENNLLLTAISCGYEYLKENLKEKGRYSYWEFGGKPNCFATTWGLMAVQKLSQINIEISESAKKFLNQVRLKSFDFILSTMPRSIACWKEEQFVDEAGAKYNKQKSYYSFSPTLILPLIDLGLSPYHPKVINQINWLINNPSLWRIQQYDQEKICTFTYAMCIATIAKWTNAVGNINAVLLTRRLSGLRKIYSKLLGIPFLTGQPVVLLKKSRLNQMILYATILVLTVFFGPIIFEKIKLFLSYLTEFKNDILINIIAAVICTILTSLGVMLLHLLKKIFGGIADDK